MTILNERGDPFAKNTPPIDIRDFRYNPYTTD